MFQAVFLFFRCDCPNGSRCARSSDDISISAYVHRCIPVGIEAEEWNYESIEDEN